MSLGKVSRPINDKKSELDQMAFDRNKMLLARRNQSFVDRDNKLVMKRSHASFMTDKP